MQLHNCYLAGRCYWAFLKCCTHADRDTYTHTHALHTLTDTQTRSQSRAQMYAHTTEENKHKAGGTQPAFPSHNCLILYPRCAVLHTQVSYGRPFCICTLCMCVRPCVCVRKQVSSTKYWSFPFVYQVKAHQTLLRHEDIISVTLISTP